jgi:hypothetical protein
LALNSGDDEHGHAEKASAAKVLGLGLWKLRPRIRSCQSKEAMDGVDGFAQCVSLPFSSYNFPGVA